jgi:predicted nuclease of predicted toxin-antitoxin system
MLPQPKKIEAIMNKLSSSSKDLSVAIYWDWQNTKATEAQIQCLMMFAYRQGIVALKKVYSDWNLEKKRELQNKLYCEGFDLLNVPSYKDRPNRTDRKLIQDCQKEVCNQSNVKTVILISKDGDFTELVKYLKELDKKVIVISRCKENTSHQLREAADEFYTFSQIEQWFSSIPLAA